MTSAPPEGRSATSRARLRVASVRALPLDLELTEPFGVAQGAQEAARNLLVRIDLEGGSAGYGEAAPFTAITGETQERSLDAIARLQPLVVGQPASRFRAIADKLAGAAPKEPSARSALEQALLDAVARAAGLPLWAMHGGAKARLHTDVTIPTGDSEHAARSARSIAARGFATLKLKVGARRPADDADRVAAAHDAAHEARIVLDANGGYDEASAVALAALLAKRGVPVALFEQPIAPGDDEAMARVRARVGIPVCADESARSAADVARLAKAGAVDAINIKIMKCGVAEAITMAHAARAAGLQLMIGGMVESEIAMLHSAHLASGIGGFDYVDLDTPLFMRERATLTPYPLEGDRLVLGDEPGLGVFPVLAFDDG